ncbi:OmpA family protein [Cellulosimicrobium sp. PMB13]|uniref:OmpA family protein n=1 Tax=Cellulosimicrobium sp. PMB13 TaxID=3120158 RepID=UPI003F4B00B0
MTSAEQGRADQGRVATGGRRTTRGAHGLVAAGLVAALLAACSQGGADVPAEPSASASPALSTDPTPVVVPVDMYGAESDVRVGPVAVHGDLAVLRVEVEATAGESTVMLGYELANRTLSQDESFSGVRLVDLEAGVVREAAHTASGEPVGLLEGGWQLAAGMEPSVGYVAFDPPTTATTDVLVPSVGLVEDVPVVDAEDAGELTVAPADLNGGQAEIVSPVAFLESYSTQASGAVRTRQDDETVTMAVDSDVLFAVDSAELGAGADDALGVVADQVALAEGGELVVVGHTDDVGDEAANQELSERRAQAVADRLATLSDLGALDVVVEGRGETEPVATQSSDEARALNRRVTVEFTPEAPEPTALPEEAQPGSAPVAEGPTVTGLGAATLDHPDGLGATQRLDVELVEVRRVGGYLVGDLRVSNVGTEYASLTSVLGSTYDGRGDLTGNHLGAGNVTLLDGSTRVYPADYLVDPTLYTDVVRNPLAEALVGSLDPGLGTAVTVVWPDTGHDVVVVDVPDATATDGSSPVRFVEVPVTG